MLAGHYHPLAKKRLTLSIFVLRLRSTAITHFYFWFCCIRTTALCNLHGTKDSFLPAAFKRGDKEKEAEEESSHSVCARLSRFPLLSDLKFFLLTDTKEI